LRSIRWLWPALLFAVLALLPWACYGLRPERTLDVAVVDKTVPYRDRREHRALFWLLRHLKVVKPDGTRYKADEDYLGAFPGPRSGDPPERTVELTPARAAAADLLYFADTYGVYEADLESGWRMQAALERSPKIYGGLETAEVEAARRNLAAGGRVVAEFNTFASPTGDDARRAMEQLLGVRWTRWIGRFFHRLENEDEVPGWMRRNYLRIHGEPWEFEGPGYVLLRDDERIEVLRAGQESRNIGLTIERERPVDPLLHEARDGVPYSFWFDLVEPAAGTRVLARYVWHLEPAGRERLRAHGLPESFPAVCRRQPPGGGTALYFAGDFADTFTSDRAMPFAGYAALKRWVEGFKLAPSESAFYWRFYVPLMSRVVDEAVQ